ncbi:MAG: hypothetical protein P1U61_04130 [Legionellaceae bacterium]|nr:hypothetical protein [Legionellaceae bacterium]
MFKLDLTGKNGVNALVPVAQKGSADIIQFQKDIQSQLKSASEAHPTTQHVLQQLNQAIELNQKLEAYILANTTAIVNPFSSSGRVALAEQIESIFLKVSDIDFDKINITDKQSYSATQTLLKMLETFQSLFPHQIHDKLAAARTKLEEKIKQYQKENPNADEQEIEADIEVIPYELSTPLNPIKSLPNLQDYVISEFKNIDETCPDSQKIKAHQSLQAFIKASAENEGLSMEDGVHSLSELTEKVSQGAWGALLDLIGPIMPTQSSDQIEDAYDQSVLELLTQVSDKIIELSFVEYNQINQISNFRTRLAHYQLLKNVIETQHENFHIQSEQSEALLKTITAAIQKEVHPIITEFDLLTRSFQEKIDALEKKSRTVSDAHAQETYLPAINHAKTLIQDLNQAKKTFQTTGDLAAFESTTQQLLKDFPGKAAFETNRSQPWFQTLVITPFEALKKGLNAILQAIDAQIHGQKESLHTFFQPAQTGTKKKFEAYQEGLKNLGHHDENLTKEDQQDTKRRKLK